MKKKTNVYHVYAYYNDNPCWGVSAGTRCGKHQYRASSAKEAIAKMQAYGYSPECHTFKAVLAKGW